MRISDIKVNKTQQVFIQFYKIHLTVVKPPCSSIIAKTSSKINFMHSNAKTFNFRLFLHFSFKTIKAAAKGLLLMTTAHFYYINDCSLFNDNYYSVNDNCKIVVFPFLIRSLIVVSHSALGKLCPNVSALCQLMPCTPHSCRGR